MITTLPLIICNLLHRAYYFIKYALGAIKYFTYSSRKLTIILNFTNKQYVFLWDMSSLSDFLHYITQIYQTTRFQCSIIKHVGQIIKPELTKIIMEQSCYRVYSETLFLFFDRKETNLTLKHTIIFSIWLQIRNDNVIYIF